MMKGFLKDVVLGAVIGAVLGALGFMLYGIWIAVETFIG